MRTARVVATVAAAAVQLVPLQLAAGATAHAAPPAPNGRYIVVLASAPSASGTPAALTRARTRGVRITREFRHVISGYVAQLDASQLESVRNDPDVAYVEPDQIVRANAGETDSGAAPAQPASTDDAQVGAAGGRPVQADVSQRPATWGLDRVDQRRGNLDGAYTYRSTGAGVSVYLVDSGIRATHSDFGGRASGGFSVVDDGHGTDDCNGHGTHVAGTVGGTDKGVAKQVRLVGVRVLDCDGFGTISGVIAGIDWINANASRPAVVNLSLEAGTSRALDQAVRQSIGSGLVYSISAGNGGLDACDSSPGRVPRAITVGATTSADSRDTGYSNYGRCVDLFAPGTDITSDWIDSDTATKSETGTSMAAPHVTGVAALYLQRHPHAGPDQVRDAIVEAGTRGVLSNIGAGSPNVLLYSRERDF
ncbi:S8 family peptidase [Frankia sp. AgB32]|uniref:S8 family peptidase n=1 Tax=Frankia sp. AgB32 TaxID=631119 RepID=UPI00200C9BC1|nr:S8 family peptidase [Frankia sp. AgB32]MCK9895323.1 S8 family peptidase [Frankia sp. AgB32]